LGLPADDVPHFLDKDGKYNGALDADTQLWLNERGFAMIFASSENQIRYPCWHGKGVKIPLISCGPTERSRGMNKHHAVVTVGTTLVYDPHPSEAGLTAITDQYLIFKLIGTD